MGALFYNAKLGETIRVVLEEIFHPQQANPMQTDNSTAEGIENNTIQEKKNKGMYRRFYFVQDQVLQVHYNVFWKPGATNFADYFTKHHPPHHHCRMQPFYIHC